MVIKMATLLSRCILLAWFSSGFLGHDAVQGFVIQSGVTGSTKATRTTFSDLKAAAEKEGEESNTKKKKKKGRKILFITTDMMRWDSLGYYGDPYAKTPVLDKLAATGIRYDAARNQNPLCMPARNSIITGQYPRTHGSWNNGIPLPHDVTTIAHVLHDQAGYRTGLIGKAHWEPFSSPTSLESDLGTQNRYGPLRGFDFAKLQAHGVVPFNSHYNIWLRKNHPEYVDGYYSLLNLSGDHTEMNVVGGGETGAVFVKENPIPTEFYQTAWTTDNAIRYIDSLDEGEDWFVWVR